MSTPSDALHAALSARPEQTARELAQALARAGHPGLTTAEVEQLLHRDPRLRHDDSRPPRWRALGAGHPGSLLQIPTPHHPAPQVLAPAASFGEKAPSRVVEQPIASRGILPAAAFAGRPSVRIQERPTPPPPAQFEIPVLAPEPITPPRAARPPVRVPALARPETPPAPAAAPSVAAARVPAADLVPPIALAAAAAAPAPAAPVAPVPAAVAPPVMVVPPERPAAAAPPIVAAAAPPVPMAPPAALPVAAPPAPAPAPSPIVPVQAVATPPAPAPFVPVQAVAAPPAPAPVIPAPTVAAPPAPAPVVATPPAPAPIAPAPVVAPPTVAAVAPVEPAAAPPVVLTATTNPVPAPQPAAAPPVERGPLPPGGEVRYVGPQLRRWQKDVLDAWLATGRRGIVEAVSAPGRGVVGVLAAWDALTRGEKVLVLVPTTDLLEQWFAALELQLPGLSIGRRGDGWSHTFDECDVLVSLVSAAFGHDLLQQRSGLLIADEVHKYGSARPAETLRAGFGARLGLTTAMERQDAGVDDILQPYFGTVHHGCDLRRGRKEDVLARFRLAFVPVDLPATERAEHDALSTQIAELEARLTLVHGCAPETFLDDVRACQGRWQQNSAAATGASAYLRAVSTRRDLLATSSAKLDALARLAPTVARSVHAVVFTHTKGDADAAANRLRSAGIAAEAFHHGLETRRDSLRALADGSLKALAAPKVIEEGVELPAVDVVVVLAGSRSARQAVQRMSPILRPTQADRLPAAVVVYARDTVEDPSSGHAEGHLEDLASVATEVHTFAPDSSAAAIAAWFVGA
ncbi:helicase-related protein [Cellulomonas sp. ICMP 17802]|uniref:helicase-related protein n=1 Tax=Cellulomonas sp. ICMP 17802 TaxID=3239199 RepID=UPI00351AB1C4